MLAAVAIAGSKYASVIRFKSDPVVAPRDVALYGEDTKRVAGPGRLVATVIEKPSIYEYKTVTTIGGVIFQGTASPAPDLAGKEIDLKYNRDLPDGQRLQIGIDGKTYKSNLRDWALIPISNYANSPYTAVVSLLGHSTSKYERQFVEDKFREDKMVLWVEIHPDLKDTLIGFNSLLVDAMFLDGDPTNTRSYTQGLTPKVPGWNASPFDDLASTAVAEKLKYLLNDQKLTTQKWSTYIFNDLDCAFKFSIQSNSFVITGQNPTYHFFNPDDKSNARPKEQLTKTFRASSNDGTGLLSLNPAVYRTAFETAQWAAFFRYLTLLSGNFAEGVGYRTDKEGENRF